jgi:SAM-dependent methyltransferase
MDRLHTVDGLTELVVAITLPLSNGFTADGAPMEYDRIRREITAYNRIAGLNLERNIQSVVNNLVGANLLARFRQNAPVEGFPHPPSVWIDSRASPVSQLEAYQWLSPIKGLGFLQLGGSGSHAIKAIMGGAGPVWLLTPMIEEGALAIRMAEHVGVAAHLTVVQGIGEQLPFADASIDRIYGGGTLHHMHLTYGLQEVARVLRPGGKAAFVDPNLNFLYKVLEITRVRNLGRERGAQCYPLRVPDVYHNAGAFKTVRCRLSGGPLRYGIVGITRVLKVRVPLSPSLHLQSLETRTLLKLRLHSLLGGLAVLLEK